MDRNISKEEFEKALPAGQSCTSEVFDSLKDYIDESMDAMCDQWLGEKGESYADAKAQNRKKVVKVVVLHAFLKALRQLDLVLTPTGFGVVSNDSVAPASTQRVNDLQQQLLQEMNKSQGVLHEELRHYSGWGVQRQAELALPYLYGEFAFWIIDRRTKTQDDWNKALPIIEETDFDIREAIGDEQMDAIMLKYRCGEDPLIVKLMMRVFEQRVLGNADAARAAFNKMMGYIEKNIDEFPEYKDSDEYKANHFGGYVNKDDHAFVFSGF